MTYLCVFLLCFSYFNHLLICVQEIQNLLDSSRLLPDHIDVRPYEVDGITYLARTCTDSTPL